MEKLWNKNSRWVTWFVHSKWYIITSKCFWKLSQQAHWNIGAWSSSLFISTRISMAIHRYAVANNNYKKDYNKYKELLHFMYLDANNLYGWTMSQKPVDGIKWKKNISKFNEKFIKNMMKRVIKDIYLKWMLNIQRLYKIPTMIYHFYQKE